MLGGALKLRYELRYASSTDLDSTVRFLRNQEATFDKNIVAVVCFAKDDAESVLIGKKIREAINSGSKQLVFIDASRVPFGVDGYSQYRNDMAQSMYQQGKDNTLATQYANNAKETLKKWKNRISNGDFMVFSESKPDGERVTTIDALYVVLEEINKLKFPCCLEGTYNVIANMFTPSSMKQGIECGAAQKTSGTFLSGSPATKLENALEGAWKVESYWIASPHLLISKIKVLVDELINEGFKTSNGRVSIKRIYDTLSLPPYGFMACNLSSFVLGFILKEYTIGSFSWSDGLTNDLLDINKLKEMVDEVIRLEITPNPRYKDKYIVAMTDDEKAFNEATSVAFDIPLNLCTSVEQTRERIRNKMKEFAFPIWTLKSIISKENFKTSTVVLETLIDNFCGIANNSNMDTATTDSAIAMSIGRTCIDNSNASKDLKNIFVKEKCVLGMTDYIKSFENGELIALAQSIGDGGQYINMLRSKFDADAANWVWNIDTAQQKIREIILEYKIILESNKTLSKNITFDAAIKEWCAKCGYIRISFSAAKNHLDDIAPFMEMLCGIKKTGQLLDSKKQSFYELLVLNGDAFRNLYNNQTELFKKVCAYYLCELTDDEIRELYATLPAGVFTYEKNDYFNEVEDKVKRYKATLDSVKLKNFWKDKTDTNSPREWSKKYKMPILCLINDSELQKARASFGTINKSHPDASSIDKAIAYLESADFFDILRDKNALDNAFRETVIKGYAVMLTDIDAVKEYLDQNMTPDPYDWFGLPEIEKRLKQMAEAKYSQSGCTHALKIIDEMDIKDAKEYLKSLIKDNMIVGMEIIKGK